MGIQLPEQQCRGSKPGVLNLKGHSMLQEEAVALVHRFTEAVNAHDVDVLIDFYSRSAVTVSPVYGEISGRAAIRDSWNTIFALFPDWTGKLTDVLVDHDRIVFMGTVSATDRNGWFGQPPTGERIEYRAAVVLTMANGKIVRDESIYDLSAVLQFVEKAQLERELRVAAEVQRALWSRTPHGNEFCEAAGDSLPWRSIGGDFFEMHGLPSGDCGITLGDTSGKGPAAAIVAAMIQGMLAVEVEGGCSPSAILSRVNRRLSRRGIEPRFATLVFGVLSPSGRFVYSNAGHNPPVLLAADGVRRLGAGGPILGAFGESTYEQEIVSLSEGDTIILFSDGVTEALNGREEEYGEDRLVAYGIAHKSLPAVDLVKGILQSVMDFSAGVPQADDISVTVARYTAPGGEVAPSAGARL